MQLDLLRSGMMWPQGWILRTSADAAALLGQDLADRAIEELRVAHLDGEQRVLGVSLRTEFAPRMVDLPVREIVREAMALGARAIVLAHNHPSGDPTPSRADKTATRRLAQAARNLDIRLLDHLIFGARGCHSFRALGLL